MTIYFVNIRHLATGYLLEDVCATFDPSDPYYGTDEAARAAAEVRYAGSVEDYPADEYDVMFFSIS